MLRLNFKTVKKIMEKPEKKDEEIINQIIERFKNIKAGEEYYYCYSPNVFDNRTAGSLHKEEKPAINIREIKEELINEIEANSTLHECSLLVDIDLIPGNPYVRNIREMKADILKAISEDLTWGELAQSTKYISYFINHSNEIEVIPGATIRIKIIYRKNAWSKN